MSGRWREEHLVAPAGEIHGRPLVAARAVTVCRAERPAVVLGSSQPDTDVDGQAAAAAGLDVVRRRSGGGAVLVDDALVWIDVVIPAGDPLWDADVGRSMWWVGEAWVAALGGLGVEGASVHTGAMRRTPWSPLVCFAGVGAGEVLVGSPSRKVVGISQRRTRQLALFQCACLLRWDPAALVGVLARPPAARAVLVDELRDVGVGLCDLGVSCPAEVVAAAFVDALRSLD